MRRAGCIEGGEEEEEVGGESSSNRKGVTDGELATGKHRLVLVRP
jgi:hypothetical protein